MRKFLTTLFAFALVLQPFTVEAAQYATLFHPETGERKVVVVGEEGVFDGGFELETPFNYYRIGEDVYVKCETEGCNTDLGYSVVSRYRTRLSSSMTSTQATVPVSSVTSFDGTTLTMALLGSKVFLTIEPGTDREEIVKCTSISSTTWGGCTRGLAFTGTTETAVTANQQAHNAGSIVVMSNVHYVYEQLTDKDADETIGGIKTFSNYPLGPGSAPTTSTQLADKAYVDTVGAGGLTSLNIGDGKSLKVRGTAPETLDINTSTYKWFEIKDSQFRIATSTISSGTASGVGLDDLWNSRYNATTTKSGAFTFSDGVTFNSTVSGFTTGDGIYGSGFNSASTTTGGGAGSVSLTKDYYFTNYTVSAGDVITTNGYRIFVSGTLTVNGSIRWNGNNGGNASGTTGGSAGAALTSQSLGGSLAGKAGGNGVTNNSSGTVGTAGDAQSHVLNSAGVAGGAAGDGTAAGGAGTKTAAISLPYNVVSAIQMIDLGSSLSIYLSSTGSGSGGGGAGTAGTGGAGGGSGSAGGTVGIYAKTIIVGASGAITANGGNGGNGANGSAGNGSGGGGGGAGSGGVIVLIYNTLTNGGSITASGGTGGTHGNGTGGGSNGSDGSNGNSGLIIQIDL